MTEDGYRTLTYQVADRKAYLTLNRPDRLNAITGEMAAELAEAVDRANQDTDVHVIILAG
ncbi:MAG TPA: enoyl-CoA hydratase-related protein, partial [Pseudonocardia sp.]|uniref:enoyl-CoA hydratase-related protein n=1 Tax=Pseudonocardia sp. TaxID=60912 RepID=UPI002BB87D06